MTTFDNEPGLVRRDHPDTAKTAALAVLPRTGTQRRRVYDRIARAGLYGITDQGLQADLDMDGNTERPRRVELVRGGFVVDSGRRRIIDGRPAIVWIICPRKP
jgi:hypothetical protein